MKFKEFIKDYAAYMVPGIGLLIAFVVAYSKYQDATAKIDGLVLETKNITESIHKLNITSAILETKIVELNKKEDDWSKKVDRLYEKLK